MLGNVSEWCLDEYHKSYTQVPADGRAWLGNGDGYGYYPGENHVVRGATWITDDATKLRPAFRRALPPAMHDNLIGFRIVRLDRQGNIANDLNPCTEAEVYGRSR
jgi:formylglycine-generating enzyme required for sulfatase activity